MANHSWILDVLNDLSEYALKNNMPNLETNIRTAAISAKVEITPRSENKELDENQLGQPLGSRPN